MRRAYYAFTFPFIFDLIITATPLRRQIDFPAFDHLRNLPRHDAVRLDFVAALVVTPPRCYAMSLFFLCCHATPQRCYADERCYIRCIAAMRAAHMTAR